MPTPTVVTGIDRSLRWLMPSGNLGDALLLSGLLRSRHALTGERFGMVRARPHSSLFRDHPAIAQIASADAWQLPLQRTDYFAIPCTGKLAGLRPWARLSRLLFGEVLEETGPWAPVTSEDRAALAGLPVAAAPILVAPSGDSPRMEWAPSAWVCFVEAIRQRVDVPVAQVGLAHQPVIQGALDLTGKLSPREILALVGCSQLVLSCDPFVTQAAVALKTPALALFGPTSPAMYGAADPPAARQLQLATTAACATACLDQSRAARGDQCPERRFCMVEIDPARALATVEPVLRVLDPRRPLLA